MSVAIYCRVSDDKKKSDGDRRQDINRQAELLRSTVVARGILRYTEYFDDAKSAYTEDFNQRKAFVQLLNDCRRGKIKEIYVEDLTRFSRNLSLGLQWLKELSELGVHIISLREGELEVTSAKGWMQSSLLLLFAEWSSRIQSEKVRHGMQKARNLGKKIGGFRGAKKPSKKIEEIKHLPEVSLNL